MRPILLAILAILTLATPAIADCSGGSCGISPRKAVAKAVRPLGRIFRR